MNDLDIPGDFERLITLGLSRAPATNEAQALATLAVLAQRKRHRRSTAEPIAADLRAGAMHEDPRPIIPDAARRPLVRLAMSLNKEGWQFLAEPIFDRLQQQGVRLHPFDLPRLEPLLAAAPDRMGPAEHAWTSIKRTPQTEAVVPAVEDEWILLPKPQKTAIIRLLRTTDAAGARDRIERHLPNAPADVRAALIATIEVGLAEADVPLLTTVAKDDRAATVRDAATALLGTIRGTPAHAARVAATSSFIELGRTLLGRRTVKFKAAAFADRIPAGTTTGHRATILANRLNQELQGLHFSDIAKQLSLSPDDLANALIDDDPLTAPLIVAAIVEGNARLLEKLSAHIARLDIMDLIRTFGQTLLRVTAPARTSLLAAAARSSNLQWHGAWDLALLGKLAGGVLPDPLAHKLLNPSSWPSQGGYQRDAIALAVFATLMPAELDADFAALIADLPRKDTAAAYEYIAFTTALQGTKT